MFELREYGSADRDWVVEVNTRHYLDIEGFSADFADAVVEAIDFLEPRRQEPQSNFIIAEIGGRPIGCVFLAPETRGVGRLRLFFVATAARGRGVGRRMLEGLLSRARETGVERIRVSTFDRHERACRLYRSMGFRVTSDEPVHAFGQRMRQFDFELVLSGGDA